MSQCIDDGDSWLDTTDWLWSIGIIALDDGSHVYMYIIISIVGDCIDETCSCDSGLCYDVQFNNTEVFVNSVDIINDEIDDFGCLILLQVWVHNKETQIISLHIENMHTGTGFLLRISK